MLEALPAAETSTNKRASSSSSPYAFVPRQVTLAKQQNMAKKEEPSKTLETTVESINNDKTKKKKKNDKKTKCRDASPLLLSIAAYLQHLGFAQTLVALQSEASIGELDTSKVHATDFESYYKYFETSKGDEKSNKNGLGEESDMLNGGITNKDQEESKSSPPVEPIIKKKKKKSDETILGVNKEIVPGSQLDESDRKSKDKKKKKSKLTVVEKGQNGTCSLEGKSVAENVPGEILVDEKKLKSKDKKNKNISSKTDTKEFDQVDVGKNSLTLEDNTVSIDKKSTKKRKKMASEGNESQPEVVRKQAIEVSEKDNEKENELLESDGHAGKKRKTENDHVDPKKLQEISSVKKLDTLPEGGKTPKGSDNNQSTADWNSNGELKKNGREGSTSQKSMKKQQNSSAEPKTFNAFQRVKAEEVEFADDRLQDNSYWAKGGAEIGYGAKAQEVLGQVRGRDFRHEKTKKKRGSYRGGQIDFKTHSVKFNYSDEE